MEDRIKQLIEKIKAKDGHEKEFIQAVEEVSATLKPVFEADPKYFDTFERLCEPERTIIFRVAWLDDQGKIQVNRGYRVQFNNAIGPYKGGIRFHPSVNLSILKFLGFEQTFKNSLTSLMMGGGKGGSDFDPKKKSDAEIMRFCQSYMTELTRHISQDIDVPAGDIGVSAKEIGYMFGQYKRLTREFTGVLTGKGFEYGGSLIRPQATGYGIVYYLQEIYQHFCKESLKGKRCIVSGAGNVAQYTIEKLLHLGALPLTCSDSNGYVYKESGIDAEDLKIIMDLKNSDKGRLSELPGLRPGFVYVDKKKPWEIKAEIAIPCATQNEIDIGDAKMMVANGIKCLCEGANMPSTNEAITYIQQNNVLFGPSKAANAGGVSTSGLEMAQDSQRLQWPAEKVDHELHQIMRNIFKACIDAAKKFGMEGNLQAGANIAGFLKVANAMIAQGCV